ncbi:MAG: carbohydrate-binding protein [Ktedonobacteraceae bacterium]
MDGYPRFRCVSCVITCVFLLVFLFSATPFVAHAATTAYSISEPATGITVTVNTSGAYTISVQNPAWTFGGTIGHTLSNVAANSGTDSLGSYKEITFQYQGNVARSNGIRTYSSRSVVLFSTTYLAAASNSEPFPTLTTYPQNPYHLSYNSTFGIYGFNLSGADSPWLFFDGQANSFILSPAANFLVANTVKNSDGSISSGIIPGIGSLPQNFTHKTLLTIGKGINNTYVTWGQALTDLSGKVRPANDADVSLNTLGYWTDNGATYYYNYDSSKGYEGTLEAVKSDFNAKGIPLGYMQLDSWWYPKGSSDTWQGNGTNRGGEYTYTADKTLFPNGLSSFQQQLGLPLITHARWIDTSSPYRSEYTMSNNVSTDPNFWKTIMSYIKAGGVMTYEQDWLSGPANPNYNLTDPTAFLNNMASAASANGLTMQYCMPLPRDYLQGTMYSNLTTMRVSNDRFESSKWDTFLYDSRLGSALGIWPWTDVFMSTETDNLLLSTLSGGMVGVGDAIGTESKTNLMQTIRPDGVIVKPDTSIVPTDETYIGDAQGLKPAMVAYATTAHTGLNDAYVFAYKRSTGPTQTATFNPNELGVVGQAYVYNYFTKTGHLVPTGQNFSDTVGSGSYYVVAPVGQSGIALLGDTSKFVSAGHKRMSHLADNGTIQATVAFANGEGAVTLSGYAPEQPHVSASQGAVGAVSYNPTTHLFSVAVSQGSGNTASITITPGNTATMYYEAENATLSGPSVFDTQPGYSGTGYADYQQASGDYVQWSVNVATAGTYTLTFRYANGGTSDRPLAISVNGATVKSSFSFPPTGDWSNWQAVSMTVNLNAGSNTIKATAIGQNGGNIDYLAVGK